MDDIIQQIRSILQERADPEIAASGRRFFKEEITVYGMKTAEVTKIAKSFLPTVLKKEKEEVFSLCEELYASEYMEESFIASAWLPHLKDRFQEDDIRVFEQWIEAYVTNWATCDTFCNHTVGDLLTEYPECVEHLYRWAQSENRWLRRAAAVSLIVPAKRGEFLHEAFRLADLLLIDPEDLVQKGYGWLLKEASRKHQSDVFSYVCQHKRVMPRTALRYAIELMPEDLRKVAMRKDWT